MEALKNLQYVKNNWNRCSDWENTQTDEDLRFDKLKENLNIPDTELSHNKKKGETLINAVTIMDQLSINKSKNALVGISAITNMGVCTLGTLGLLTFYLAASKKNNIKNLKTFAFVGYSIFTLIGAGIANFINAHFGKLSTRVARYQTRNNELKDVRNFVVYTDEQIEKAKKNIHNIKDVKDITSDMAATESFNTFKVYKKSLETIKKLKQDYKAYRNWRTDYAKKEAAFLSEQNNIGMTQEEEKIAQKDKNFILRTIKKMELATNEYEMNLFFGIRTIALAIGLTTIAGGLFASWGLGKLSQSAKVPKFVKNIADYSSKLSVPAGIIGLFFLAGPFAKFAKEVAKIGRFKAIEKMKSDAKNFYPYTDEELHNQKNEQRTLRKRTVFEKLKSNLKVVLNVLKDFKSYKLYADNKKLEDIKLAEALKGIPITDEQLKEARKLQKQMFMAFEKIDDKSESIVDDTSAATDSLYGLLVCSACCFANLLTLKLFGNKIKNYTKNNAMPSFFEGLKLTRKLTLRDLSLIFILPYLTTRCLIFGLSFVATEIKKKACKIGIMGAMHDLNNPKKFFQDHDNKFLYSDFIK